MANSIKTSEILKKILRMFICIYPTNGEFEGWIHRDTMKRSAIITGFMVFFVAAAWPLQAVAGAGGVEADVTCRIVAGDNGSVVISGELTNPGEVAFEYARVYLFFGDFSEAFENLPAIPPGGHETFHARFDASAWIPGTYTIVVMADVEDRFGARHRFYHPFSARVKMPVKYDRRPLLDVASHPVRFNPKAFGGRDRCIRLALANRHHAPVTATITPYLKDGYHAERGAYRATVEPGGKPRTLVIPLHAATASVSRFLVDVQYEAGGVHHSLVAAGDILPRSHPVYFRIYLYLAGTVLLGFLLFCWFKSRAPNPAQPD
jgi:hypothetical protein